MFYTRFETICIDVHLPFGWAIYVDRDILRVGDPNGVHNIDGTPMPWRGRKWLLSDHMTDGEVVQTAWLAFQVALEHEMRETFLYKGQAVFDPHYDINKLVALRAQPDALKERS